MSVAWKRFLFLQFPLAAAIMLVVAQLLAWLLADVPLRRERTDDFAIAVLQEHSLHRVLLFGDSTTRMATKAYNVGDPGDVLNLTSEGFFGLAGDALLLQRYLTAHPAPAYVVLSNNPHLYTIEEDVGQYRRYLWSLFQQPDEHLFLWSLYPTIANRDMLPAVLDTQARIVEPFLSLLIRGPAKYDELGLDPRSDVPLEPASFNAATDSTLGLIRDDPLKLTQSAEKAINKICQLSAEYGFSVQFLWSPSHVSAVAAWRESGRFVALEKEIGDAAHSCVNVSFYNSNDAIAYPSFDHEGTHLRGEGWKQRFTSDFRKHLMALINPNSEISSAEFRQGSP
ncbi:MAG: hypothetical protein JWM91_1469 [Rhodospirillales bacterium]|nr:hypothetical protein [Rhodospirillales bacterium]